jgi:phospholipid-binding lipoprotein MlaA
MITSYRRAFCSMFFIVSLILSFYIPGISEAVNRLDSIQPDISDEYLDEPIINEAEMAALEQYARDMAKTRTYPVKSPAIVRDIALPGKETENGLARPILLALNESHKTTAETSEKKAPATEEELDDTEQELVADPFEPVNRVMFDFNDKIYYWAMKPFYGVYNAALPEEARTAGRNFFENLAMPVRFVSCTLQIKPQCAGVELARFCINSTIGMAGLFDIAAGESFSLKPQDADTGTALGYHGIGEGFYIVLPFMGPSSLRDAFGMAGDSFLTPYSYLSPFYVPMGISAGNYLNRGSLQYTEYEELKESAIDPYAAFKDAYIQYRRGKIKK